ncbi:MAG TPA: right-handed parallel beta-helix repeat-containing protein, partial [Gemmatimonadales bacterium]|nr:right-handed parallel beta-helix repeat-containing protein [Gemmatimonadales bacterium]
VRVLDNDISAPEPDRVPFGWPSLAIGLRPSGSASCAGTRIERNRIAGHTDGVVLASAPPDGPGAACRDVTIRENVIRMQPVLHSAEAGPLAGTPAIGVPIRLLNMQAGIAAGAVTFPMPAPPGGWPAAFADASVRDVVVEGNDIEGATGVAIELVFASHNRVRGNRIGAITPMTEAEHARLTSATTFGVGPGIWVRNRDWRSINGTAVWAWPGGRGNDVAGNTVATARPASVVPSAR